MSGFEVVGVVLAVLPLLVSALEHYDDVLAPFVRYKHFSSRFRDYFDELEVYRTIFRTECVLLVGTATTKDEAIAMIDDFKHQSWSDKKLGDRLYKRLGSLGSACVIMIQRIETKLQDISTRSKEFDAIAKPPASSGVKADSDWTKRVGKKLKFCIRSDKSLHQSLEELSKLNNTFRVLSSQVIQLESGEQQQYVTTSPPEDAMTDMSKIHTIREASVSLYDTLSCICTAHDDHLAQFHLDAALNTRSSSHKGPHVHFNLSWLGPINQSQQTHDISMKPDKDHGNIDKYQQIQTKSRSPSNLAVRLDVESSLKVTLLSQSSVTSSASPKTSILPDAATISDSQSINTLELCRDLDGNSQFSGSSTTLNRVLSMEAKELSAVLFSKTGSYQHCVRASPGMSSESSSGTSRVESDEVVALSKLLSQTTKTGRQAQLPQIFRLYLAKELSAAALQYHDTCWLPDSLLRSDEVYFARSIGSSSSDRPSAISTLGTTDSSPFVYVPLKNDRVKTTRKSLQIDSTAPVGQSDSEALGFPKVIPNETLYHLGILLLELAYNWPFASLVAEVRSDASIPISPDLNDSTAEYLIAQHLASSVGTQLGASYANVVQKCLRCDFGCGTQDLHRQDLQERVFRDVFSTLEELETNIRQPQSGFSPPLPLTKENNVVRN